MKRALQMKQKAVFVVFEGLSFGEKIKNLMKKANTSFKLTLGQPNR